jgi:hypothetical protein
MRLASRSIVYSMLVFQWPLAMGYFETLLQVKHHVQLVVSVASCNQTMADTSRLPSNPPQPSLPQSE